jgi:2'-5' RNA ligase
MSAERIEKRAIFTPGGSGVMIALVPDAAIAKQLAVTHDLAEAPNDMHLTLAYFGDAEAWGMANATQPSEALALLATVVRRWALNTAPVVGEVTGGGFLDIEEDDTVTGVDRQAAAVALLDCPGLGELRAGLCSSLEDAGIQPSEEHDFLAHVSLAYGTIAELAGLPVPPSIPVTFSEVVIAAGAMALFLPLDGDRTRAMDMGMVYADDNGVPTTVGPVALAKADDAKRYTLAPLYVPDLLDSHGDWTDAEELRKMVWGYTGAGRFDIKLQHQPDITVGRCVEIVQWPYELSCEMVTGDGVTKSVTLPAGTVYQGVHWEPWAYEQIRAGKIRGMSLGGRAFKLEGAPA